LWITLRPDNVGHTGYPYGVSAENLLGPLVSPVALPITAHFGVTLAVYRGVVRHVRYWRGGIHRWSTVYNFVGAPTRSLTVTDAQNLLTHDSAMCYRTSAANGGVYECQLYDQAVGGTAFATYTAFDWTTPGAWVAPTGTGWTTTGVAQEAVAETALQVEWAGGLSSSGKPVFMRKWYHMVPSSAVVGGAVQVGAADVASLQLAAQSIVGVFASAGLVLGSASSRLAGVASVKAFYGTHQMPKGRKRKALVTAGGRYTGPTIEGHPLVTIPD
jgi:hypothetical protein